MLLFIQLLHSCLLRRGKGATCYRYSQALTYSILLSTIFDGPPLSPERETCCMLLFVQLSHSCLLSRGSSSTCYRYSYTLTYSILLSSIRQQRSSRDEWVLPDSKMAPELYKIVRPGAIFFFWDKLIAQTSYNFAAGRDGWIIPSGKMPPGCTK